MKICVVGTHEKLIAKALLMNTHNMYFHAEIRKILVQYCLFEENLLEF